MTGTPDAPRDDEHYSPQDPAGFTTAASFYEVVGGHETFARLVERFYDGVAADPVLRPLYPEQSLDGARKRLLMFLEQYWGGPTTYQEQRGHPRLRMRHAPFAVNPEARDRWIGHMRAAVDSLGLAPLNAGTLMDYLDRAAHSMVNTHEPTAAAPEAPGSRGARVGVAADDASAPPPTSPKTP